MSQVKPMLAYSSTPDLTKLKYPVYGSPKLDGIRAMNQQGVLLSRSLKPIRNRYTQHLLGSKQLNGLDGELVVGNLTDYDVYLKTNSGVMSADGEPDVKFYAFDTFTNGHQPFELRLAKLRDSQLWLDNAGFRGIIEILEQVVLNTPDEVQSYHEKNLALGYEGTMLRSPAGLYKHGRSTLREGYLLKVKDYVIDEAVIVEASELMHNTNESFVNELGFTDRSAAKDGLVPSGMIGAFVVKSDKYDMEFNVSCGSMDHAERQIVWQTKSLWIGKTIRFKYFPHGMKDVPRHPIYAGTRDADDMSE